MPDERSPIQHALVLHRVDPIKASRGSTRFWSSATCSARPARPQLGRVGTNSQELVKVFAIELEAGVAGASRPRGTPATLAAPQ